MTLFTSFAFVFLSSLACFAQSTLYYNARVFTGDSATPEVSYFVIENGIITKTGKDWSEVNETSYATRIDLQSKFVIPGLVDSHVHFVDGGLGLLQISFFNVKTKRDLIHQINSTKTVLIDGMYIGRDLATEPLKGTVMPIQLLDSIMADVPTILFMKSGHAAVVNTSAMKKFGFKKNTVVADGTILKDATGKLTGLLLEGAAMEANRIISSSYSNNTVQKAILRAQSLALSYGITTIGDNTFNPYFFKIYQELQKNDLLKIRVRGRSYGRVPQTESLMKGVGKKHLGIIGGGVDESRVKYHAMKFFEDQSLSMSTTHQHGAVEPGGKVFLDIDQLNDIFELHPESTFAFHVQGKAGIQNILNVVSARQHLATGQRHILDHAGYASSDQIKRAGELGLGLTVIAGQLFDYRSLSSFYRTHASADQSFEGNDLLNTRIKYHTARAALTSDYPYGMDTVFAQYSQIDGLNPFPMMAVTTTGRYPDGSFITGLENKTLTLQEAIKAFTSNGAFVLNEANTLGKIAPGFYGDFVVLDDDIFTRPAIQLYSEKVLKTYIHGELVFDLHQEENIGSPIKTIKVNPSDYAISPVIGYDPTLGIILGGAYFKFPLRTPGRYFDAQLQAISGAKLNFQTTFTHFDLFKNTNLNISGSYSNFFQYYFGEGNKTTANDFSKLFSNNYRLKPELAFRLRNNFQVSLFGDVRGRQETKATSMTNVDLHRTFFANENTLALGLTFGQDTRDNAFSTKKGTLKQITVQYVPSVCNVAGAGDLLQLNAEVRHFHFIGRSKVVVASRLAAGFSQGTAGYLFRYTLGGAYALRGYYSNRFRGEKYYVGQLEARFPIYKRFSGASFFDAGDVTDDFFIKPKISYGAGVRFALSQNIKLRLDYGMAKDQTGVFFTFSEAF